MRSVATLARATSAWCSGSAAASMPRRMAMRTAVTSTWHPPAVTVEAAKAPPVSDVIVNITFVNYAGNRTTLPGKVGDTLYDVARRYHYEFLDPGCGGGGAPAEVVHEQGSWLEPKYGEGPSCFFCHVIVPKSHYHMLPAKRPDELQQLGRYPFPEDMTDTSRLACQVRVTKEMDGMVVYVPDGPPSDIP